MFSRIVMTSSSVLMAVWGIVLTFLPGEFLTYINLFSFKPLQLMLQVLGAFYFSFGLLNWMYKKSPVGGIYLRPLVVANLAHFFIAGTALVKALLTGRFLPPSVWLIGCIYICFTVAFGILLFRHPGASGKEEQA